MAQKVRNQGRVLPAPNRRLTAAVAMRPPASMSVGEVRAPSTPLTNLEKPYAMGNSDVSDPICTSGHPNLSHLPPFRLAIFSACDRQCASPVCTYSKSLEQIK